MSRRKAGQKKHSITFIRSGFRWRSSFLQLWLILPPPQTLLTFSFSVRVWPWSSGNHSDPCILIEFSNKQALMLKDSDQSMDTIRATSRLCPSNYMECARGGVCATHTHVHAHTPIHPHAHPCELPGRAEGKIPPPTDEAGRMYKESLVMHLLGWKNANGFKSKREFRGAAGRRAAACLLHSVACCSRRRRFAPAITLSHLGAHRFCWFHFRNAQPTCFPE